MQVVERGESGPGRARTYMVMPNSFSPLRTFMASMASGMARPPRTRTPSMSKAKTKESATADSRGGETGVPRLARLGVESLGLRPGDEAALEPYVRAESSE